MRRAAWWAGGAILILLLPILVVVLASSDGSSPLAPSANALADIPGNMLVLYESGVSACPGLSWTILAGIGKIETNHGRSTLPGVQSGANFAGAMGPMQFLAGTWAVYGDGVPNDVYNPAFAIPGAARLLCASGAPANIYGAIFAYNHADWYVREVLAQAAAYGAAASAGAYVASTTAAQLLANPRVIMPPEAQGDVISGVIDARVIDFLNWASINHVVVVSVLKTGHSQYVEGTNRVSNHYAGRAADIAALDGIPVTAANPVARNFALEINALTTGRPTEVGTPWADLSFPGYFSDANHQNHIHVGWGP